MKDARLWVMVGLALCGAGIVALSLAGHTQAQETQAVSAEDRETPGALVATDKEGKPLGLCPLKHTDVKVEVSGFVARVEVTQKFHNPFNDRIEAVYTFPLSQNSAVDDMLMTVGKRTIRGQIKKREEARRIYEAAKQAGHVASLLDQERPNIFTQSVANIMPGENVDITIRYVEVLKFEDAWYEFSFPTVVGPRYIPGQPTSAVPEVAPENRDQVVQPGRPTTGPAPLGTGREPDTDQVPDASRITPPIIAEGMRAGHDISISMRIDAGVTIRDMQCESHEIRATHEGRAALVRLKEAAAIPNKDFVVRYTVATGDVQDAVLTHAGELGRYATLILQPPVRVKPDQITPKELVFVLDTSGSMGGAPIEKAKATMMYALDNLNPKDTFNFITFAGDTHVFFPKPVEATPENVGKVQEYLATRKGSGGTEMMKAILAALEPSDKQDHMRIVCFMTDGYVGNDMQILDEIQRHPKARVFSFGIGGSVNRYLLDGMANLGRGEVEYIPLNAEEEPVAKRFYERMRYPVLTDISIDWGGLPVAEIVPKRIPDLFSAKPVVVHAKATGPATGTVTLRGKVAGEPFQRTIDVTIPEAQPENEVLAPLWARAMIQQVMNQDLAGIQSQQPREDVQAQITDLGLKYRLVTQFTSFVAVEELIVTEGDTTRTIAVPVEMPEGVSYEGIFGDRNKGLMPGMGMGGGMTMAYSIAMPAPAMPGGMGGVPGGMPGMGGGMPGMPTMPGMPPVVVTAPQGPKGDAGPAGPRGERGPVGQPDANLTPEQKREFLLNQRLDAELLKLAQDPAAKGKAIEVTVWLSDDSPEMIAKLKELGLTVIAQARAVRMVVGRVNVERLEELALADGVRFVEPMKN